MIGDVHDEKAKAGTVKAPEPVQNQVHVEDIESTPEPDGDEPASADNLAVKRTNAPKGVPMSLAETIDKIKYDKEKEEKENSQFMAQ